MDSTTHTPRISYELVRPIFELLIADRASLCALSLCSSIFRDEAQNMLFRDVTNLATTNPVPQFKFLSAIASSPSRLGLLVRAYQIMTPHEISTTHLHIVRAALEAMHNLKRLDVGIENVGAGHGAAWILRGCQFSLERFDWLYRNPLEVVEVVEWFLPGQSNLHHLGLHGDQSSDGTMSFFRSIFTRPIAATICPKLISLTADWEIIKACLPTHRIATLLFNPRIRHLDEAEIRPLAPALKYITAVSNMGLYLGLTKTNMDLLLRHCVSLKVLELQTFDEENDPHVIRDLPALCTLILPPTFLGSSGRGLEQELQLARHVFNNSSENLQHIYIPSTHGRYNLHTRAQDPVRKAIESEVRRWWLPD